MSEPLAGPTILCDVADINPESISSTASRNLQFRYVDLGSASRGNIDWSSVEVHRLADAPSRARRITQSGDVLFGTVRPALESHGAIPIDARHGEFIASTGFAVLRPRPGFADPRFLFHYCFSDLVRNNARRAEVGSNYPAVNESDVAKFTFPPLSLPQQQQIADILDTFDGQIIATEQIIAKLNLVKQGLLSDLFTSGIDEHGQLRDLYRNPEQFKESSLGRVPKDWRTLRVNELLAEGMLLDVQDGNHGELHPKRDDFAPSGVAFLMAQDITGGNINFEKCYRIRTEQYSRLRVGFARPGDVLLSHKGTIGEVAIVPKDEAEVMLTPQVTYYRLAAGLLAEFLSLYMRSDKFQLQLRLLASQSTRDYIGITAQRRLLRILVPSIAEQRRISMITSNVDELITKEAASLAELQLLKRGLMADLLSGHVRLPAEVTS
jgi:type I restriction enzyme, S subunit